MGRLKRFLNPVRWTNLRTLKPVSRVFGLDRGTPVDRFYIEKFLRQNERFIKGRVLEIGDSTYTTRFGSAVEKSEVLHYAEGYPGATIVGDLTKTETLPEKFADCFICTQTLNFIYDFGKAVDGIHFILKEGGTALVTLAGLSQISRYDMDRWGDFWRFTDLSAKKLFEGKFAPENIVVEPHGNVLTAVAMLHGITKEELTQEELETSDQDYQIVITVRVTR